MLVGAVCCRHWSDCKPRIRRLTWVGELRLQLQFTYRRRHFDIFGPGVTSAATSVGPGRMSKLATLPPVEPSRQAIAVLLVAVRSAAITKRARGWLAFAICSTRQA